MKMQTLRNTTEVIRITRYIRSNDLNPKKEDANSIRLNSIECRQKRRKGFLVFPAEAVQSRQLRDRRFADINDNNHNKSNNNFPNRQRTESVKKTKKKMLSGIVRTKRTDLAFFLSLVFLPSLFFCRFHSLVYRRPKEKRRNKRVREMSRHSGDARRTRRRWRRRQVALN